MKINVRNECVKTDSYRAARVRDIFNCEDGSLFEISAEIPVEDEGWAIGLIVGASGSGKSSIGAKIFGGLKDLNHGWSGAPIIDDIAPGRSFEDATAALVAAGLGSVPAWLRPYKVLSNGEKFRAGLARILAGREDKCCIDEFTSVIDRDVAKTASAAFAKAWRRRGGQCVLLSCHYDIIEWVQPDWVFDTSSKTLERRSLRRRPDIKIDIREVRGGCWRIFEEHHYLTLPLPIAARFYVGCVGDRPVAFAAATCALERNEMRLTRLVVLPEWQGVGVGTKFLDAVAALQIDPAYNRHAPRVLRVSIGTSHTGLAGSLLRRGWKKKKKDLTNFVRRGRFGGRSEAPQGYFGGHTRAVQTFYKTRADLC